MNIFDELNDKNFKLFAAKNYNNPGCSDVDEFEEDISRFKYLKRLFTRYEIKGDLKERLILNHLIILYNIFGIQSANRMIWYKIAPSHWSALKTFLVFLNFLSEHEKVDIPLDKNIIDKLRNI